ncbi:heavy metal transporter [Streptomyces sp. NPDC059740]|uniref:heavy metal transporter n=1 Tax=Streptomyces sp. NPDC059740 TaxID=3346926 RepID=UPI00365322D7
MSSPSRVSLRTSWLWRLAVAFAVLVGLVAYLVVQYVTGGPGVPTCTVDAGHGEDPYELSPEQAANAATISAVGSARGLPERAVTIALATAMQESELRNVRFGDRDSVGLFQQRPSQDWGTRKEILDPVYSAGEFYTHLAKIPGYARLPLTVAAQQVQRSAFPQAYAKHESHAAALAGALTGREGAALSCVQALPKGRGDANGAAKVRGALVREFGPGVLPRASAGASTGSGGTPPYELTVPVAAGGRAAAGDRSRRGWELANWAMAHSADLRLERISYAGRTWTVADSGKGWQQRDAGDGKAAETADDGVRIVIAH